MPERRKPKRAKGCLIDSDVSMGSSSMRPSWRRRQTRERRNIVSPFLFAGSWAMWEEANKKRRLFLPFSCAAAEKKKLHASLFLFTHFFPFPFCRLVVLPAAFSVDGERHTEFWRLETWRGSAWCCNKNRTEQSKALTYAQFPHIRVRENILRGGDLRNTLRMCRRGWWGSDDQSHVAWWWELCRLRETSLGLAILRLRLNIRHFSRVRRTLMALKHKLATLLNCPLQLWGGDLVFRQCRTRDIRLRSLAVATKPPFFLL